MIIDQKKRIEILESCIRYALSFMADGFVGEAGLELERVLDDPDMQIGASLPTLDVSDDETTIPF